MTYKKSYLQTEKIEGLRIDRKTEIKEEKRMRVLKECENKSVT